ncbi:MAG: curli production assembly protein CsgG [unclassified Hahellaceae]|nr:curli production assembly protein CsgG [Hahellaceae bacterium]
MFRHLLLPMTLFASLTLGACSGMTGPETSDLVEASARQSKTGPATVQIERTLKRKVAIARFTDETRHRNASALDQNDEQAGKQTMAMLSRRLSQTGKFMMVERSDLTTAAAEKGYPGAQQQLIGADYLIVGSISEFGRSAESEVGMFSRNKIQTARAKVDVRLIDVRTGQIIFSQEASGEASAEVNTTGAGQKAAYDASLDDKAIAAALGQLLNPLVNNLLDQPWRAPLIGEQDGMYMLAGGQSQGIAVGDEFKLMIAGQIVRSPQSGILLELPGKQIGTVKVESFSTQGDKEVSLASVVSGRVDASNLSKLYVVSARPAS